jgi:secreted PhoX family phosphatase
MNEAHYEGSKEKIYSVNGRGDTFESILARRLQRRSLLAGAAAAVGGIVVNNAFAEAQDASPVASPDASPQASPVGVADSLRFTAIEANDGPDLVVADGYTAVPFLAWGEPLFPDAPAFDPAAQTAAGQAKQVGYNHDFSGFLPLPIGSDTSDHGLLVINHEYTNPELMFTGYLVPNPDYTEGSEDIPEFLVSTNKDIVDIELEAHGVTVAEIQRNAEGVWELVLDSPYNRRITATTPMALSGPVAGNELTKTSDDPTGATVLGTLNNCSGGLTPWGTFVTCEENFHQYFGNTEGLAEDDTRRISLERFGLPAGASERQWEAFYPRFDVSQEPNEAFRFGWAVEIDPYDAAAQPKKRTSLGRFKHEAVNLAVTPSGQVAVYTGDDERFEYVYKWVSTNAYDPNDRAANADLLDDGTLYVAVFNDDGSGNWIPLVYGENGLDATNDIADQAAILIDPRTAGDVVGATKMDRPEDIEVNPVNQKVYMVMTNNTNRGVEDNPGTDESNPRPENIWGHIIEVAEAGGDHAATEFEWDIFLLCGDPADESTYFAGFPKEKVSKMANPDNITFDTRGNLWISTDGQPSSLEVNDGLFAVPVDGADRGYLRQFFSSVTGSEVSGPHFTPDDTTLFAAIQHPGEGGTFDEPISSWPGESGPPRPAMVVIQSTTGAPIGS